MKVGKIIFVILMVVGIFGFLLLGGTEMQIAGLAAGAVALIAAGKLVYDLIKGLINK